MPFVVEGVEGWGPEENKSKPGDGLDSQAGV